MNQRPITEAWGEFLSRYRWDWYCSFTFRDLPTTFRAHRQFRFFVRDLEQAAGVPVAYFRADEYGERLGRFHLHALILNVGNLRRMDWVDGWNRRHGFARIFEFDPTRGAAYYIAKYVTKQLGDWELSENLVALIQSQPALLVASLGRQNAAFAEASVATKRFSKRTTQAGVQEEIADFRKEIEPGTVDLVSEIYEREVNRSSGRRRRQWFLKPDLKR